MLFSTSIISAQDYHAIANGNNQFSLKLFQFLQKENPNKNILFSPFSISSAMAMTYAGAKNETESQIKKVMNFNVNQNILHKNFKELFDLQNTSLGSIKFLTANSFWIQKNLKVNESFIKTQKSYYNSEPKFVDFSNIESSRDEINQWVENKTEEKIKGLIQSNDIDKDTRLILINAIYFYADWQVGFKKTQTYDSQFSLTDGQERKTPFMHITNPYNYFSDEIIQAIELPYKNGQASMIIILPKVFNELNQFEKSFDSIYYKKIISNFHKDTVTIALPKFKSSSRFLLKNALSELGMPLVFNSNANFSGIMTTESIHIGEVVHQSTIEVSEEGTEATAATSVLTTRGVSLNSKNFNINHAFIYIIKENASGCILFIGKIVDPI
jgi:serpin B